ncbi:MAG: hypothetical protein RL518_2174 [Pseudomonadota bacterium]|jgi:hypothetical protein
MAFHSLIRGMAQHKGDHAPVYPASYGSAQLAMIDARQGAGEI